MIGDAKESGWLFEVGVEKEDMIGVAGCCGVLNILVGCVGCCGCPNTDDPPPKTEPPAGCALVLPKTEPTITTLMT